MQGTAAASKRPGENLHNAEALGNALAVCMIVPWTLCCIFYSGAPAAAVARQIILRCRNCDCAVHAVRCWIEARAAGSQHGTNPPSTFRSCSRIALVSDPSLRKMFWQGTVCAAYSLQSGTEWRTGC